MSNYALARFGSSRTAGGVWPVTPNNQDLFTLGFGKRTQVQSFALSRHGELWPTVVARIERDRDSLVSQFLSLSIAFVLTSPATLRNEAALRLLESWRAGDEQEQRETWTYLKEALDKDRLGYRKLFS